MPERSSLARLQQAIVVVLLATAAAWLAGFWRHSPTLAVAGAILIFFGFSLVLAAEFVLVTVIGDERTPRPTPREGVGAWWGETCAALQVFFWRQPFRWRAEPDSLAASPRRGVVFVHGFVCNRGFWNPWLREMRAAGHPFAAVNLEPVFGSIDGYAPTIDAAVAQVTQASGGLAPVLVCHSMGGLAARAWLRLPGAASRVHHVVTIGTPHGGTWLGKFSHTPNGMQMRLDGEWVTQLARDRPDVPFTCWYSNCDNIVFPASTATLAGADNRLLRGVAHVELAFRPEIAAHARELLSAPR